MNHFPKVIGLSGVARSGKDSFYKYLAVTASSYNKSIIRVAFADQLKKDLADFIYDRAGISVFTNNTKEKEIIRPILVAYGQMMRNLTKGAYWVDKINELIESTLLKDPSVSVCITDVRFPNEVEFVQGKHNGYVVHLSRKSLDGSLVLPPNEEESEQDPILRSMADYTAVWETYEDNSEDYELFIQTFLGHSKLVKLLS